jgi:ElaB/YqjD/DUF883 family membrane-anchored ribosome-binding protein
MSQNGKTESDIATILDDVNELKRDFAMVLDRLKQQAVSTADDAAEMLTEQGQRSIKAVRDHVEEQPLLSLAIAFSVGFIGGRFLSR